jgi:hypothetical protein
MTMQYDVKQGHLNQSGFFVLGRNRVNLAPQPTCLHAPLNQPNGASAPVKSGA